MKSLNKLFDAIAHRMPPLGYALMALLAAALILYVGTRPGDELRPVAGWLARGLDKLLHFTAYAAMAACVFRAVYPFESKTPARVTAPWLWVLAAPFLVGALDETLQSMTPGRSADWRDLLADTAGGLFVLLLGMWGRR